MNNKTDILNELNEISPILLQIKENEKPLVIPVNYFEQLADAFIAKMNSESGLLSSIKKEKTEVPATYFDTFADTILAKIKAEAVSAYSEEKVIGIGKMIELPQQQNKIFQLFKRVTLAASVVGAVFLMKEVQQPNLPVNDCKDGIACLSQDEIFQYMRTNSHEFNMQQIKETVQPIFEKTETNLGIDKKEATQYIEQNKNVLDVDDASTDIF